jgi:hypothetical protein
VYFARTGEPERSGGDAQGIEAKIPQARSKTAAGTVCWIASTFRSSRVAHGERAKELQRKALFYLAAKAA